MRLCVYRSGRVMKRFVFAGVESVQSLFLYAAGFTWSEINIYKYFWKKVFRVLFYEQTAFLPCYFQDEVTRRVDGLPAAVTVQSLLFATGLYVVKKTQIH